MVRHHNFMWVNLITAGPGHGYMPLANFQGNVHSCHWSLAFGTMDRDLKVRFNEIFSSVCA